MIPSTAVVTSVMGFYHRFNFWVLIESVILPSTLNAFDFFIVLLLLITMLELEQT